MADRATRGRPRLITLLARAALGLLLLFQLAALWVIAHPSPTRLPAGVVGALAELGAGRMDLECREATIDRRGRVRLGGVRLSDSQNPGDALSCDIDVLPDWGSCLRGQPALIALQVRGRGTLGEAGAAIDDFVVRLGRDGDRPALQAAARTGSMVLRADLVLGAGHVADAQPTAQAPSWNRALLVDCLRTLRSMDGGVCATGTPERLTLEGGFVDNPAAVGPLPIRAASGRLVASWDGKPSADLSLSGLRIGGATAARAHLRLDKGLRLRAEADEIRFDGLQGGRASVDGSWRGGGKAGLRLRAETADSRLSARIETGAGSVRAGEIAARVSAADLASVSSIAQAARSAGIDLCGMTEILGGEASWTQGELVTVSGSLALSEAGWRDIRPKLVRPESDRPSFQGDLSLDLRRGRLSLSRLDLAGLRGDIACGMRAGDDFVIRLASSEGQPVNPSCLNSLLGEWWTGLWARFDLSTSGERPHADVRVEGRWGEPESVRTDVRAQLRRFGFMGARFAHVDLRVNARPEETLVRIDSLRGELDGKDAGTARGTVRWDWRRKEWQGQPQIDAEGDLLPAVALRLHDVALAGVVREWTFGNPRLRVSLGPDRPLRVALDAPGESTIAGVKVAALKLSVSQTSAAPADLSLEATGELSGGKASVALNGDLASRNQIRLSVREWSRSGLENLVAQIGGPAAEAAPEDPSQLTVLYEGTCDFSSPWTTQGKGRATLTDPRLKTVHLMGGLSKGLDALGIGFSNYTLNKAEVSFTCNEGKARVEPLKIEGDDAALKLKGFIDLQTGKLALSGQIYLKDSPWGFLKYINPNRLIAKMISVNVVGAVNKPEVRIDTAGVNTIK